MAELFLENVRNAVGRISSSICKHWLSRRQRDQHQVVELLGFLAGRVVCTASDGHTVSSPRLLCGPVSAPTSNLSAQNYSPTCSRYER